MIVLKSPAEIAKIRTACAIVAETLLRLEEAIRPGMTTQDLDRMAEEALRRAGARPAFKGYRGYPAVLCVSVNAEVVHGIPSPRRVLKEGDIVGLDFGAVVDGYYGDAAITVGVGAVSPEAARLMRVTREALERGIEQARVGNRIVHISGAIQDHAEAHGYSVVREFVGHGIGTRLHEEPQVPNYRVSGPPARVRLLEGLVLAIEPMVNAGGPEVRILDDGWTAVTADGSLSAHFEHTLAVTADGPWVLSRV
ncbi:MAG TPA: type I methionyl aminopeptidase [Thermodesulfobacteriota bacterium]|nr:type I methionyl aminopeptidase [Thermodesulfobacteriota bacterium]